MKAIAPYIVFLVLIGMASLPHSLVAEEVLKWEFPILVLNCQTDPGDTNPNSGRARPPGELEHTYGCTPAVGVGVTAWNPDLDFQARCDTDEKGQCTVGAPTDLDHPLTVAVHTAMLDPGFEPRQAVLTTVVYTEYAGVGIVNLPVARDESQAGAGRQILTVNVFGCESGLCTVDDVLAQISPAELTSRYSAWLGPDDRGMVSFDLGSLQTDAADLMFTIDGQPEIACRNDGTGDPVEAEWLELTEGNVYRIALTSDGDVTCDVTFNR